MCACGNRNFFRRLFNPETFFMQASIDIQRNRYCTSLASMYRRHAVHGGKSSIKLRQNIVNNRAFFLCAKRKSLRGGRLDRLIIQPNLGIVHFFNLLNGFLVNPSIAWKISPVKRYTLRQNRNICGIPIICTIRSLTVKKAYIGFHEGIRSGANERYPAG